MVYKPQDLSPLRGRVVKITGDSLFAFVESFRAKCGCRVCLAESDVFPGIFPEDQPGVVFRSKDLYSQHSALDPYC